MSRSVFPPSKSREFGGRDIADLVGRARQPEAAGDRGVSQPRRGIGLRIQVALATGVLMFVVAGFLGGLLTQDAAVRSRVQAGQSLQVDAMRIADQLHRQMSARAREMFLLGSLDPMYSLHDGRQVQSLLTELRTLVPAYYWIGLTDPAGRMIASTNPELLGGDFSARPEIREGLRGFSTDGEGAAGPRPGDDPLPMTLSHPVRGADGGIAGVIVAQLQWRWVRDLASIILNQESDAGRGRAFVLINSQDRVLLGPPDLVGQSLTLAAAARARSGFMGWSVEAWPDHTTYLTGAAVVHPQGAASDATSGPGAVPMQWTVLTRLDASLAFAPTRVQRAQVALGGVLLGLIGAALGWLAAGLVTTPLRRIAVAAEQISLGAVTDFPAIERPGEIAALVASLRRLLGPRPTLPDAPAFVAAEAAAGPDLQDPLTGLLNRDGLRAWLIERMRPQGRPCGSLMVFLADLDSFKAVNDRFGRATGDDALGEAAARIARRLRATDAVARFGSDEFIIILDAPHGTGDEAAEIAIFDIFDDVSAVPYQLGDHAVSIGISLGGAMWPQDDPVIDQVIAKAHAALLAAKQAGKGRIIMHQPEPAAPGIGSAHF